MEYIIIIMCGYLIGSLNPAGIFTKLLKGEDIREVNSKNAGASNATLTLGLKWGIIVFLLDAFKGFLPVFIVKMLYPENDILWVIAGIGALLGHVYPLFMNFKGGKGTSTYLGVVIGLSPILGLILFVLLIATTVISDYIVIGTMFLVLPVPFVMIFLDFHWISIVLISLYALLNMYKHSNNFIALYKKEETGLREGLKK